MLLVFQLHGSAVLLPQLLLLLLHCPTVLLAQILHNAAMLNLQCCSELVLSCQLCIVLLLQLLRSLGVLQ
jgi:hypothetical protein